MNTSFKPDYLCDETGCKGRETYNDTITELHKTISDLSAEVDALYCVLNEDKDTIIALHKTINSLDRQIEDLYAGALEGDLEPLEDDYDNTTEPEPRPTTKREVYEAMAKIHCEWNFECWDDFVWSDSLYEKMLDGASYYTVLHKFDK